MTLMLHYFIHSLTSHQQAKCSVYVCVCVGVCVCGSLIVKQSPNIIPITSKQTHTCNSGVKMSESEMKGCDKLE